MMKINNILPVNSIVLDEIEALWFLVFDLVVMLPDFLACKDNETELYICTIKMVAKPTSRILMSGLIFSRLATKKLKFSAPV